jgi:hypothetical protein
MRKTSNLLRNSCFTLVLLASLFVWGLALAPPDRPSLRDLRRVRREITDALQPSIAVAGKDGTISAVGVLSEDVAEYARAGAGTGGAPRDPAPGMDASSVTQELPDKYESADFIAADVGQETATAQDATSFQDSVEISLPSETTATAPDTTATPE